ncbi:hypothetical protein JD844_015087, partial [Phrynosoma platyrhinos]
MLLRDAQVKRPQVKSCCNQKVPVPSQQLFEPSRVCKSCYSSLHPSHSSLERELDKPI